jgi:hypothetical protein
MLEKWGCSNRRVAKSPCSGLWPQTSGSMPMAAAGLQGCSQADKLGLDWWIAAPAERTL